MLRRTTPLRRSALRRRRGASAYARRPRDGARMAWVKTQPCSVSVDPPAPPAHFVWSPSAPARAVTYCSGPIEADHMGERGLGRKADDATCAPMCRGHHRERTDHAGTFRHLTQGELRAWRERQITRTQAAWESRGEALS